MNPKFSQEFLNKLSDDEHRPYIGDLDSLLWFYLSKHPEEVEHTTEFINAIDHLKDLEETVRDFASDSFIGCPKAFNTALGRFEEVYGRRPVYYGGEIPKGYNAEDACAFAIADMTRMIQLTFANENMEEE